MPSLLDSLSWDLGCFPPLAPRPGPLASCLSLWPGVQTCVVEGEKYEGTESCREEVRLALRLEHLREVYSRYHPLHFPSLVTHFYFFFFCLLILLPKSGDQALPFTSLEQPIPSPPSLDPTSLHPSSPLSVGSTDTMNILLSLL